ncbi:hypothetical protein MNBD_GAMMA17-401 [hydrothermal vent metagenome]|uniref:Uncharacterized protein n=1 Tax=hydrothermal vent metagenome TaxID=652676 RepID=A0A3B0ZN36_9ZZZZ
MNNAVTPQCQPRYRGVIIALILCLVWMVVTGVIGTLGLYEYPRNGSHLSMIITVLIPTVLFALLCIFSPAIRSWTKRLNLAMLTLPHAWRTVGFTFLVGWYYGILPAGFAAPAGFGDFIIGIAALFVAIALWLQWSGAIRTAVWFHILGMTDLFFALLTGMTGFGIPDEQMTMVDPMTAFPLVIIPTVFVPLLLVAHVMALTQIAMNRK